MHTQIEKAPISDRAEDWQNFNERINGLAEQGYTIIFATDKYIILHKP